MAELYAFLLYAMAAVVAVVVIAQGLSRSVELFSARNIYLAGFIVYQLFSPAGVLMRDSTVKFQVKDIDAAGLIAVGYAAVFLVVYFLAYRFPGPWRGVAGWLKTKNTTATDASLLIVGFTLVMLGLGMRLAQFIPYIRSIAFHTGVGLAAVSCVFVGWVVARRYSNILVLVGSAVIFIAAVGLALDRSYGRRPLVGVCLGLMWGIYFSLGNRLKPKTLLLWLAPLSLAALLIVSSFTAVRGRIGEMTFTQVVQEMVSSKRTLEHAAAIFDGQLCGEATLWCIEAYPKKVDQQHILSLRQMVLQVIPRSIWPEKPEPLANQLAKIANIDGVNHSRITLPPGVIGYAAAEGGLYALVLYAIFYGGFCRFFDLIVTENRDNPFMIAAASSVVGHMPGLARGDLANLTNNAVVTFVAIYVTLWMVRKFVGKPVEQRMIYWQWIPAPTPPTNVQGRAGGG
ncbi:MAG: hypothetical protein AAGJ46_02000 [Planctomycetota bacterium]